MEILATLVTDLPLDEARFRSVLFDCSRSSLAGAILQKGMTAVHSFGEADRDAAPRDVQVVVRSPGTIHPSAAHELRRLRFEAAAALEFHCDPHPETREDAWALVHLYAEQLRGWVVTDYLSYEEAAARQGSEEGLLRAPVGGRKRGVLIAARALESLAP